MEQFCIKCGWWRSKASENCKKNHLDKKQLNPSKKEK